MEILKEKIIEIAHKIEDYKKKNVLEPGTKRGLVEPLFEKIGWDFSDIDVVVPEFPVELDGENNPADYALKIDKKLALFFEAKRVNLGIKIAIEDGTKKALKESVPWLIASNGDTIVVLNIDEKIPEHERTVFQIILSNVVNEDQTLTEAANCLLLLSPKNVASDDLKTFAEQKLKSTRITNTIKKILNGKKFEKLVQEQYEKQYQGDKLDPKVLKEIMGKINIGTEKQPISLTHKPKVATNPELIRKRLERIFKHPNKTDKEKINNNIREKKELWLEFIERKRMSTPEFKDFAVFKKKGTGGFGSWLTYYGLATKVDVDKIRKGAIYEINEEIIPEIKAILDVT